MMNGHGKSVTCPSYLIETLSRVRPTALCPFWCISAGYLNGSHMTVIILPVIVNIVSILSYRAKKKQPLPDLITSIFILDASDEVYKSKGRVASFRNDTKLLNKIRLFFFFSLL